MPYHCPPFFQNCTLHTKPLVMNKLTIYPLAIVFAWTFLLATASAQFNVRMNVLTGTSTTTCTDPIGAPEPQWAVNINNAGWVSYPSNGICYTNFPNEQFNQTYACLADIPPSIPVCFRAFENDASILNPCNPVYSCQAELCINVPVPPMGTVPFTITLPAGGQSGGSVNMNIAVSGLPGGINDALCNAIPLGVLQTNLPVGFPDTSIFNNFCATNLNEPDPGPAGAGWFNNQGVWFTFTTSANPSDAILIEANSDPSNFGDPINLQVAIFESSDNTCGGSFTYLAQNHSPTDNDEAVVFTCPKPNTTYYILVDGVFSAANNIEVQGWFGLQATQLDVQAASELRCTAEDIGTVPLGGSISTQLSTNACSMNSNATAASAFGVQKTVWFTFTPPPTGHVFLQGTSSALDPIGLQLAVYYSSTNGCTGMVEVASQYTATENDEILELHCLDPNTTYYIMVDGASGNLQTGIFSLTVTDAGNETPTTSLTPTICFGETFAAGGNIYNQTGLYFDTLQLAGGCDSIVITNLTVLPQLQSNLQIVNQGVGLGNTNGAAEVAPSGGAGSYTFAWSNGQTGSLANNLVGGDNYCVTITDGNNCQTDTCFLMPFYVNFIPSATGSSLACFGDLDGTIEFSAFGGVPPYIYEWQNSNNTFSGTGQIPFDGQVISLANLPGGQYSIHLSDIAFDTTLMVEILEPTELIATVASLTNATCFEDCNGAITLNITGGTPPYQTDWSNGSTTSAVTGLCAGQYGVTITDANGCSKTLSEEITEPLLFTAAASQVQAVSCFQGSDGKARVTSNENLATILWSNGETTSNITGLVGGDYTVTVTNSAGCSAMASVTIDAPTTPVVVVITELRGIACQGDNTGELVAIEGGPGSSFSFAWSNGSTVSTASDLPAGTYTVTISNENGCSSTASATLTEPTELTSTYSANEITCLDPFNAGIITVENVSGGNPPYSYSANGVEYSPANELVGYPAGDVTYFIKDAGGCVKQFQASIIGPEELLVDLGNDESINLGDSIRLQTSASQVGLTYLWSPADGLSCMDCAAPVASPTGTQTYTVLVTSPDGCTATDDIVVSVKNRQNVYIPNVFSPNGDGINDEFLPFTGISVQGIRAFRIFDRQGNQVFAAENMPLNQPSAGWNGDFEGRHMQPAVFVWLAEIEFLDGRVRVYKGDVTLVR
jgi:gliding motility-associated-like protein